MTKITYDPSISLGHILSACTFLLGGIAAYYDLKSDVRNDRTIADQRWEQQKIVDTNQDQRLTEIKVTVTNSTDEIMKQIYTLRR